MIINLNLFLHLIDPKCKPENVIGGYLTSVCVVLFVFFLLYLLYYFNKGKKKNDINDEILKKNLISGNNNTILNLDNTNNASIER